MYTLETFYSSKEWKNVRQVKIKKELGLCEKCYRAGNQVHHVIPLTEENVNDLKISLGMDNLQLLCIRCHNEVHSRSGQIIRDDLEFTKSGDVILKRPPGSKIENLT